MAVAMRKQIAVHFIFVILFQTHFQTFAVQHYDQSLYLDSAQKYYLAWTLDNGKINFLVRVNTSGYVGFGLAPGPNMVNSDIAIGGVKNGNTYFGDYYATANRMPIRDDVDNWNLTSSEEINGQTILKFWRNLVTGDSPRDNNITDEETYVIWAYGTTDEIAYHDRNRGSKKLSFLSSQESIDESTPATQDKTTQTQKPTIDGSSAASVCLWYLGGFSIIVIVTMINILV